MELFKCLTIEAMLLHFMCFSATYVGAISELQLTVYVFMLRMPHDVEYKIIGI